MTTLQPELLEAALAGLEQKLSRVQSQIATVRSMMGGKRRGPGRPPRTEAEAQAPTPARKARKKRKLSPEGRQAIVQALQRRWAEKKAAEARATPKKTARKKSAPKFSELKARDQRKASKKAQKKTTAKKAVAGGADEVPF